MAQRVLAIAALVYKRCRDVWWGGLPVAPIEEGTGRRWNADGGSRLEARHYGAAAGLDI